MEKKNDKTLFGVMNILFNAYGVPQFMRGNSSEGVKHIILSIVTCGVMAIVYEIKGIIEGIRILKLTDEAYMAEKYAPTAPSTQA